LADSLTSVLVEAPTPERIEKALAEAEPGESFQYLDGWERPRAGTSFFRFAVEPSGRTIVVKTGSQWSADDAERLCEAHASLTRAVSEPQIEQAASIHPVTYLIDPPSLVMPDVGGTDVVSILRDPHRPEWESMTSWIRAAGAMLAAFHAANPAPPDVGTGDIVETARRMRIDDVARLILDRAKWEESCAAVYGDFGPGNLIGVLDGPVYLIDPPMMPPGGPIHRDLGNFVFELRRQLAGHGHTRTRPVPGRFDTLLEALLDGYSERSGSVLAPSDEALIALYEMRRAAGMARKRLSKRPFESVWFARSALERRREVVGLAGQPE
jgi:hypothetical protein